MLIYVVTSLATDAFGATDVGTVVKHESGYDSEGDKTYTIGYTFAAGGVNRNQRANVSRDEFERIRVGDVITLRYLPSMPGATVKLRDTKHGDMTIAFALLFSILWDAVVALFVWVMLIRPHRQIQILRRGLKTQGSIIDTDRDDKGDDTSYKVKYRFAVSHGVPDYEGEVLVSQAAYAKARKGELLTVFYMPKKPEQHVVLEYSGCEILP